MATNKFFIRYLSNDLKKQKIFQLNLLFFEGFEVSFKMPKNSTA